MTGIYDEWEEARRLVERGERKLSDYGGELPGTEPPQEWKRYFDWHRQFRLSEFRSGQCFELPPKMFDQRQFTTNDLSPSSPKFQGMNPTIP